MSRNAALLTALFLWSLVADAQTPRIPGDPDPDLAATTTNADDLPLEEVISVAPRRQSVHDMLRQMRRTLLEAEDDAFELFNSLNADNEFDVTCDDEPNMRSHIFRRTCRTAESRRIARDAYRGRGFGVKAEMEWHQEELNEQMIRIGTEHPEFERALTRYFQLKRDYEEQRSRLLNSTRN